MPEEPQYDETRAVAKLPSLEIEIIHRRNRDDTGEMIGISLHAAPSFAAFDRYFAAANPWLFWTQLVEAAWAPWLGRLLPPPGAKRD